MCKVHDGEPELARLPRLRKSQITGLLVTPARAVLRHSTFSAARTSLRRALALLRLVKIFAVDRTKAKVNPPAPVPQITGADT